MPYAKPNLSVDRSRGLVEFSFKGVVTIASLRMATEHLKATAHGFIFHGIVWDLRESDISEIDLGGLIQTLEEHPIPVFDRSGTRSALVIVGSGGSGLGRLWACVGETVDDVERQVFDDIGAARDWVAKSRRDLPAFPMEFDSDLGIVRFNLVGEVSADAIMRVGACYRRLPQDAHLKGCVWDFRRADLSTYDHNEMTRVFESNPDLVRTGGIRIAVVAATEVDRNMMLLWERKAEFYDQNERRVFGDMEEACAWILDNPTRPGSRERKID